MTPDLDQLLHDPKACAQVAPEEARALLLELAPVVEGLRLAAVANGGATRDRALRIAEAAALLGMAEATLYEKARQAPFAAMLVDTGTRSLRFSERRLLEFLKRRSVLGPTGALSPASRRKRLTPGPASPRVTETEREGAGS